MRAPGPANLQPYPPGRDYNVIKKFGSENYASLSRGPVIFPASGTPFDHETMISGHENAFYDAEQQGQVESQQTSGKDSDSWNHF
jgi:hypothetical protein